MRTKMKYFLGLCGVGFMAFGVMTQARAADKSVSQVSAESDAELELTEDGLIQIRHKGQGWAYVAEDGLVLIVNFPSGKGIAYIFRDETLLDRYVDRYRPAVASALDGLDAVGLDADVYYDDVLFEGEVNLLQVGDGGRLEIEMVLSEATEDFDRRETVSWVVTFKIPELILPRLNDYGIARHVRPGEFPSVADCPGGSCSAGGDGVTTTSACCPSGSPPFCIGGSTATAQCLVVRTKRHLEAVEFGGSPE